MGAFRCKSRDSEGGIVEQTIEAGSQREALLRLEECGLFPIQITERAQTATIISRKGAPGAPNRAPAKAQKRAISKPSRGFKIKRKQLLRFSIQLANSLEGGIPMLSALEGIRIQLTDVRFQQVISEMITDIKGGMPLSVAMSSHPRCFSQSYVSTIAAGERSGSMDTVLENLAEYLEAEMELVSDVRSALMYPVIVVATLFCAISVLMLFVVPRFAAFYEGFNAELPLPTKILIAVSNAASHHFLMTAAVFGLLVYGFLKGVRTRRGKRLFDRVVLKIPVIGQVVQVAVTLQAVQMLGLFTGAGVAMLEGLRTIARTSMNSKLQDDLLKVCDGISAGETLTDSLHAADCFPLSARQMLANGEAAGTLERSCVTVTKQYRKDLSYLTKNLSTLIEPLLTVLLACVVLFVALAAFLPMWDLVKIVG